MDAWARPACSACSRSASSASRSPTGRCAATPEARAAALGEALRDRGYSEEAVVEALGLRSIAELRYVDFPVYERRRVDEPLATLAQLFLLIRPVGRDRVESVLAPDLIDGSLLRAEGDRVVATAMITPFAGVLVASDPRPEREPDHVPGISRSTATAAALAVRRPVASALDLGTGSGALALLAAGPSDRVTATDVNSRAFPFGRLSAQPSGVDS